jgi:hypothetical protein
MPAYSFHAAAPCTHAFVQRHCQIASLKTAPQGVKETSVPAAAGGNVGFPKIDASLLQAKHFRIRSGRPPLLPWKGVSRLLRSSGER